MNCALVRLLEIERGPIVTDAQREKWEKADKALGFGKAKKKAWTPRHGDTGCIFVKGRDDTMCRYYADISDEYSDTFPKVELPDPRYWRKAKDYDPNVWLRTRVIGEPLDAFRAVFTTDGHPYLSRLDLRVMYDNDSRSFALGHRLDVPGDVSVDDVGAAPNAVRYTTQERLTKSYDWQWWKEHEPRLLSRQPARMREGIRWAIKGQWGYELVARHVRVNADKLRDRVNYFRKKIPLADGD
jgi:hypothetical protein